MLENLHFLRPLWLLLLIPVGALWLVVRRATDDSRAWQGVIDAHLLQHLRVPAQGGSRWRPVHLVTLVLALGTLAMAGPTWEREPSPFTEDVAPLVVALDLSPSMNAVDIQPSRLERAKQKVQALLQLRAGARTGLVVYAGSAHVVLPPSEDPTVFASFLAALQSDLMPVAGRDMGAAAHTASRLLSQSDVPGTILFITDTVGDNSAALGALIDDTGHRVAVLVVGTEAGGAVIDADGNFATDSNGRRLITQLDRGAFDTLNDVNGISVVGVTADDADVHMLQRRIASNLRAAQTDDTTQRWRDQGYLLVFPMALLVLLWFRRGWAVQWGTALWVTMCVGCSTRSNEAQGIRFTDLWWTPDQQGQRLLENDRAAEAAARFEDPAWRGMAAYRAGLYEEALEAWARIATPESYFNQGNALALQGELEAAITSYEAALAERPDWVQAQENRDRVAALIPAEASSDEEGMAGDPTFNADQVKFDEKGKQGKRGEIEQSSFNDEQIADMWMRRLQTSPAGFLRNKFALEAANQGDNDAGDTP